MAVKSKTAHRGSFVATHTGIASMPDKKHTQSDFEIFLSHFFTKDSIAINPLIQPDKPIAQHPIPAPLDSSAKNTVKVAEDQITHVKI